MSDNNPVFTSLAEMKNAEKEPSRVIELGMNDRVLYYFYQAGDFATRIDDDRFVKLNNTPATEGALIRLILPPAPIAEEPEYPKDIGRESGSATGWSVELRTSGNIDAIDLHGQLVTRQWKKFDFYAQPANADLSNGVPVTPSYSGALERYKLLPYAAIQSLRWLLHAHAEAIQGWSSPGLESRLVRHEVKYSFDCKAISEDLPIGSEDRSDCRPVYEKKQ